MPSNRLQLYFSSGEGVCHTAVHRSDILSHLTNPDRAVANNLHISYDLGSRSETDCVRLHDVIQSLGGGARVHDSLWYIRSEHSAPRVAAEVWSALNDGDCLYVIDATNNDWASYNLHPDVESALAQAWGPTRFSF